MESFAVRVRPKTSAPMAKPRPSAAYFQGNTGSPVMWGYNPVLREPVDDVRAAWRQGTARAIDILQNSGWLSGGVDEAIAATMGKGLRLNAKPDWEELGWPREAASLWARRAESGFETWARNPVESDQTGRFSLHRQIKQSFRGSFATGEMLLRVVNRNRPGASTYTKVKALHPMLISDRCEEMTRLRDGIRYDADGAPVSIMLRARSEEYGEWREREFAMRDEFGRPMMIHAGYMELGQGRAITPLAPVIKVVRQYDQLADATLTATLLQTLFAATLKSPELSNEAFQALATTDEAGNQTSATDAFFQQKLEWYKNTKIDMSVHGRIAHLFPGEELNLNAVNNPSDRYESFSYGLLREVARCLGITFEQLTGNHTQATYSSVRMANANIWQIVESRREDIVAPVYQYVYQAWLEEQIAEGHIPFEVRGETGMTAWMKYKHAALKADWRGPARPVADDLKAANAMKIRLMMGVTTLEQECAEAGSDWEDVAEQTAQEIETFERFGIQHPVEAERGRGQNELGGEDDTEDAPEKEKEAA